MAQVIKLKKKLTDQQSETLKGTFLDDSSFDTLIEVDTDGYSMDGQLLFKFRKNIIPAPVINSGYEAFKDSIGNTQARGTASGAVFKRIKNDGTESKITVGNTVEGGLVGYMDPSGMIPQCRKTAFTRDHFDQFAQGIPFVQHIDGLYKSLCQEHYDRQKKIAIGTNQNYIIGDTSFSTVTVNKNFQTAVHKDSGDFPKGFGNLCVYTEGNFSGAYFVLPEYKVAVDLKKGDMLFVDVHKWHGNTAFKDCSPDYLRVSFVMYYREYIYKCKQPSEELKAMKMNKTGYLTL